ncbi:hypothetical protein V7793_05200 [Streptomyces sp. KLMMK]|uniref:hypothetical protein n=1 Tax=Streptomyces sp. KLMMK TaxID=3109353 RepID=UPI002FFE982C
MDDIDLWVLIEEPGERLKLTTQGEGCATAFAELLDDLLRVLGPDHPAECRRHRSG